MEIINQPYVSRLGDKLKELLAKTGNQRFDKFFILVAYVKSSGVNHLKSALEQFKSQGGIVNAIVGIDQRNTSIEGLRLLNSLANRLFIYHNESPTITFHPKMYMFEKENVKAVIFIGSGNLTEGGLYTNYELKSLFELDLTSDRDRLQFSELKAIFEHYSDTSSPLCKAATEAQIQSLIQKGYIRSEAELSRDLIKHARTGITRSERVFGSESFVAPRIRPVVATTAKVKIPTMQDLFPSKGRLLWMKRNLPSSDAQQVSLGTSITGVLRFSQEGFAVNGSHIDHKVYFFNEIFGGFIWDTKIRENKQPLLVTEVRFQIKILGDFIGEHELKISHDPARISGQNNVPTTLHWKELIRTIQRHNVTGKTLSLYAAPQGYLEPFFIDIT